MGHWQNHSVPVSKNCVPREIGQRFSFEQNFIAKRSKDMRMDLKKFENKFKIKLPDLKKEIYSEIKNYKYITENK